VLKRLNKLSTLRVNFFSSYVTNIVIAVLGIIFVPIYLRHISAEAYGLIGVFTSLQLILSVLDGGLGGALTKEIAYRSTNIQSVENTTGNLVKTLEIIYWLMALAVGIIAVVLSPLLARHWVQPVHLTQDEITRSFILLSLSLIFLFPAGLYSGGMIGLQRHLRLNILKVSFALIKNTGSVLVLIFFEDKLLAFFGWNLAVNAIQSLVFRISLWKCLEKKSAGARFSRQELDSVKRYAVGITGINLTALVLTQVDRVILSKVLPLDQFGCYTLAGSVAVILYQIVQPINQSFFPKFVSLTRIEYRAELKGTYRIACQVVSLLLVPAFLSLAFFSRELLYVVTGDALLSEKTKLVLTLLALGNGLNGLLNIPYQLSLAHGWTKYSFYQNILMILTLTPLTIWLAIKYGAVGGAFSWFLLNVIILICGTVIIHRRLLQGELLNWLKFGFFLPVALNTLILYGFRVFVTWNGENKLLTLSLTFCFGLICLLLNAVILPEIRKRVAEFNFIKK